MSRLIDQVGLTAGVGLTDRAGLYKFGTFDPLALNPYAFFDGESYKGTLENPTLDLDPATPSTLDVITATRSGSTATYTDSSGLIQVASADTVRVDHVDGVPMILCEPSATNLVTHSDFSGGWQEYLINSSAGSGYASQPSRVISSTGANAAYYIPVATSNGATYTASIWARRVSGSGGCNIIYLNSPTAKQSISLTSEFQKFTATFTGKSGGGNVNFGVDIVTSGDSIEIAMPQVETGSVATSYIPTSGSTAQRAADDLEITGSAFSSFFNGSEGTFYIEAIDRDVSGGDHAYIAGQGTSQFFLYKNNAVTSVNNFDGVNLLDITGLVSNQLFRAAASYNSSVKSLSFNGTTVSGNARATGGFSDTNILKIGSGYTNVFSGHYRRILYWPYSSENL